MRGRADRGEVNEARDDQEVKSGIEPEIDIDADDCLIEDAHSPLFLFDTETTGLIFMNITL